MPVKMKDSGVEWIGEIPEGWEMPSVRNLFEISRGRVIAKTELDNDFKYPVYSSQTKDNGILGYINTYDFERDQLTWTTDGANAGTTFLRKGKYNCTNICGTLLSKHTQTSLEYYKYAIDYVNYFNRRADTNGFKIMNNEMAAIKIPHPPLPTQTKIANYLDKKVSLIDSIIEKTKQTIEEYKAYKQALITEVVTKGLDKNAKMKDSGIEWNPKIPSHWNRIKVKNVCFMKSGDNLTSEEILVDSEYSVYGGNGIRGYYREYNRSGEFVLIGRQGALCGNVRYVYSNFWATEHALVTKFNKYAVTRYFFYLFDAMNMNQYSQSSAQPGLSANVLMNLNTCLPSNVEQIKIANFLDKECSEIDIITNKKQTLITELESYKKSLIYEVVTGKREV